MQDGLGNPQSVLVLGGTSDIAVATVRAMTARRLRRVVLAGRDTARLEQVACELRDAAPAGLDVVVEPFDALATDTHESFVDGVFGRHGDIDLALVAFGVLGDQELAEERNDEAVRIVATNYVAAVTTCLPLARRMREQGHGTIVVLSSVAGERVRRANFVYGSSKAGLDAFAQGLGDAVHGSGVRVVVVRPGFVHSAMTAGMKPAPLSVTPDAVATAIVDALGRGDEVVHVPSTLRWVFTVLRHLPRPVFRKLPL